MPCKSRFFDIFHGFPGCGERKFSERYQTSGIRSLFLPECKRPVNKIQIQVIQLQITQRLPDSRFHILRRMAPLAIPPHRRPIFSKLMKLPLCFDVTRPPSTGLSIVEPLSRFVLAALCGSHAPNSINSRGDPRRRPHHGLRPTAQGWDLADGTDRRGSW